jgi:GNAT superfamily N-acetyltransferase
MIHIQRQRWEELIDKTLYLLTTDGGSVQLEIYDDADLFPDLHGSNRAYIFRLWVEEGQRNKGIASALLNTAEEIVRRNGIDAVYLNYHKKAPRWIYDWYVRRGYKEVDCSNEEQLMKLTLTI